MSSAPHAPAQKSAALETNEALYGELRPGVQDYWRKTEVIEHVDAPLSFLRNSSRRGAQLFAVARAL